MGIARVISENNLTLEDGVLYSKYYGGNTRSIEGFIFDDDFILSNGDDGGGIYIDKKTKHATISFRCLARFFNHGNDPSEKDIVYALQSISVVCYEGEEEKRQKTSPGYGYVKVYDYGNGAVWHKSPTILFKIDEESNIYDDCANPYILMGVDDNQYFGCLINPSKQIKSIKEAKLELMPKHIRGTSHTKIQRQGEWFFVKLDGVPNDYEGAEKVNFNHDDKHIQHLLRGKNDHPDSNTHVVECHELWFVEDT